jgi:hypothetical protein
MKFKPAFIWNDLDMVRSLVFGVIIGTIFGLVVGYELWKPVVVNCFRPLVG